MKNQLMIDIETTGQNPGCKVLSLGAYGFNRDGNAVEFYCKFDAGKQDADGLTDEHATMEDFWAKQSREAFEEAFSGKTAPAEGIGEFKIWFLKNFSTEYEDRFRVWACGLDFDFPILKQFFKVYGYAFPWPFWTQYDYRTIKNVFPRIKADECNTAKHTALEDAKAQMRGLQSFYGRLENEAHIMLNVQSEKNVMPGIHGHMVNQDIETLLGAH
jgi:hypothetical protein